MFRSRGVHGEVRQVDVGLGGRGQLDLGLLGGLADPLDGHLVLGQVDALVPFELGHQVVEEGVVEVLPAQERVAVGGFHLEDALLDLQHRDVERAAAQVVHGDTGGQKSAQVMSGVMQTMGG